MKQKYVLVFADAAPSGMNTDVLLIEKQKPAWQKGCLNLPGGKVEPGESVLDAAVRELKEESGLESLCEYDPMIACEDVKNMGVIVCGDCNVYCVNVEVCKHQELQPRPEECEQIAWYNWNAIKNDKRLMPNLRIIIPLMMADVSGWAIRDQGPVRGSNSHKIGVKLILNPAFMEGEEE